MRIGVFATQPYDRDSLAAAASGTLCELAFFEANLNAQTARMAEGCQAVCCFVNDQADEATLQALADLGIRLLLLRCAGFNNVDLKAAKEFGFTLMRVPEYSPHAVAEHTVALLLCLNRCIHRASNRVREGDFRLAGLLGFDLYGKTVGIIGTGRIGTCTAKILRGFGCEVLASDRRVNDELVAMGVRYVDQEQLLSESRVISLHCPLTLETRHLINRHTLGLTQPGVVLINTSRGALVDTSSLIQGLKSGHIGGVALDVYEEEAALFFVDHSMRAIPDDTFARLLTFPNVLITGHQGFFTQEALNNIAATTIGNAISFASGKPHSESVVQV